VSDWLSSADPVIVTIPKRIRRIVGMNIVTILGRPYIIFFNSVSILLLGGGDFSETRSVNTGSGSGGSRVSSSCGGGSSKCQVVVAVTVIHVLLLSG